MKNLIIGLRIFIVLSVITGLVYPALVTGIGQGIFSKEADGSLIYRDGQLVGSELLAQKFSGKSYFWPRPSVSDYSGTSASASNLSVGNEALQKSVSERQAQGLTREMIFASGSGLDPHISPEAALDQLPRIEQERHLTSQQRELVLKLIQDYTQPRQWGFLGELRVNVLMLNLAMDKLL